MRIVMVRVGRGGARWADEAVATWTTRLRGWATVEEILVRPEPFRGDVDAVRAAEGERVTRLVRDRDRLVVLDERGEAPDSDTFRAELARAHLEVAGRLVMALGGPYGHDPALRARADRVWRLSALVLNHEVARVVLVEQLYRALAAHHGAPYGH